MPSLLETRVFQKWANTAHDPSHRDRLFRPQQQSTERLICSAPRPRSGSSSQAQIHGSCSLPPTAPSQVLCWGGTARCRRVGREARADPGCPSTARYAVVVCVRARLWRRRGANATGRLLAAQWSTGFLGRDLRDRGNGMDSPLQSDMKRASSRYRLRQPGSPTTFGVRVDTDACGRRDRRCRAPGPCVVVSG